MKFISTLLSLIPLLVLAMPATGQFNRARTHMEKIRSLSNEIQSDRDDARLKSTAKEILEHANSMGYVLSSVGETLARASGPYDSERSLIQRAATSLQPYTKEVAEDAKGLIALVDEKSRHKPEDYKSALDTRCQGLRLRIANGLGREWPTLDAAISKTRGWMREQLNAALTLRDNSAKPLAGLQAIEEQVITRLAAIKQIMRDRFNRWVDADIKLAEANVRENTASREYEAARSSDAGQSRLASLLSTLKSAGEDKKAAAAAQFEAFEQLERVTQDGKRAMSDLARPMADIRYFVDNATSDTINKRWAEFDAWTKLLEYDLSRS